jgi:REP element-mobilizing transposase RayT
MADTMAGPYKMVDKYYKEPRKRMRLEGYDYSLDGVYFVTICTHGRAHYFGHRAVSDMVYKIWNMMPERYDGPRLDEFIVMPNHVHGIIQIVGADRRVGPCDNPDLSRLMQWFKAVVSGKS